jgi:TetR/AcrR family transcriptional repressor of nem operon
MVTSDLVPKERLLRSGAKLFYAGGYNGTSVDAVLADAGVPKGSFYHYFGSKAAFAGAVLDRYGQFQCDLFSKWAAMKGMTAAQRLAGYVDEMGRIFIRSDFEKGCLVGKFAAELGPSSPLLRIALNDQIQAWRRRLAGMLAEGQDTGDVRTDLSADELAGAALALIQGYLVLASPVRDDRALGAMTLTIQVLVAPATHVEVDNSTDTTSQ